MRFLFGWKGLRAVSHWIRRWLSQDRTILIDDFDGDLSFYCHLDEHMGSQIYWYGSYSVGQLEALGRILGDDMVFLDIGANQGEFALYAAKRVPRGRVVAFEPMTDMNRRLLANIDVNGFDNVRVERLGLWSGPTTKDIFWSGSDFVDGSFHEGLGTFFQSDARSERVETVQCIDLDSYIAENGLSRIDVVKIDVEGAELEVLQGANKTLAEHRPVLIIEADQDAAAGAEHDIHALFALLQDAYSIERITRSGRTEPLDPAHLRRHQNLLCTPL